MARYYELGEKDVVITILTDSMELYGSRVQEMARHGGELDRGGAIALFNESLAGQRADNFLELTYPEAKRIHNLKYYTWVEQQGKGIEELNAQWSDASYWTSIQGQAGRIDQLIEEFNAEAGTAG
jgi:cysteine synthase